MAVTYILRSTNSDLTGGADFNLVLDTATAASSPLAVTVAASATEVSYGFTETGVPGANGATGNYTVEVNVTSANANIQINTLLSRVNSSGTVQNGPVGSDGGEQSGGSTGIKTFNFTSPSLGTWTTGDRLRVSYSLRGTHTMGNQSISIDRNTTSAEVVTPFSGGAQQINANQVTETDATQVVGKMKRHAHGQNTTTDEANPHTRLKSRTMGLAW